MLEHVVGAMWPAAVGFAVHTTKQLVTAYLAHVVHLRTAEDSDRLTKLETEVRSLIQAQNLKGLGR